MTANRILSLVGVPGGQDKQWVPAQQLPVNAEGIVLAMTRSGLNLYKLSDSTKILGSQLRDLGRLHAFGIRKTIAGIAKIAPNAGVFCMLEILVERLGRLMPDIENYGSVIRENSSNPKPSIGLPPA